MFPYTHSITNGCIRLFSEVTGKIPASEKRHPHLCGINFNQTKNQNKNNMNNLRNSVRLIGNLGAAPEVKILEKGNKVARINMATNETYTNAQGEKVTETNWHNLVAWGKTAEIAEKYLAKGSEVAIEGKLTSRSYNDKDGVKKYITEVVVHEILMLDKKS